MKSTIYKIGCTIGWLCILTSFFIKIGFINLLGVGFMILGITFLFNFYFNDGKVDYVNYWWQDVVGIYCIGVGIIYQLALKAFSSPWYLEVAMIIFLGIKYNYATKKLGKKKPRRKGVTYRDGSQE